MDGGIAWGIAPKPTGRCDATMLSESRQASHWPDLVVHVGHPTEEKEPTNE
jgi:hypothetical protein